MIEPRNVSELIEASPYKATQAAIVAELGRLLKGVTVVPHIGKLDVNDVVKQTPVQTPGVMVGWTSARADRQPSGSTNAPIQWVAYIVTKDMADTVAKKATGRADVAYAIGSAILAILNDPDHASWGVAKLDMPAGDPAPALVPIFTAQSWTEGVAYYAVTWTQTAWVSAPGLFGGAAPAWSSEDDGATVAIPHGDLPTEIQAIAGKFFGGAHD